VADNKDYKIKVYKNDDENKNRQLYKNKNDILRKWVAVYGDVDEHGDKNVYEKCLVEAFNVTEFVMDNFIEEVFNENKRKNNLKRISKKDEKPWYNGTYLFLDRNVEIDFYKLLNCGYSGKTEIVEKMGRVLPEHIHIVRQNRNKYAHGTDTYKNSTREELDSFDTVKLYMKTLGELLVAMGKLPKEMVEPTYEDMRLQVGGTLGYGNKYAVLNLIKENSEIRLFEGRNGKNQKDIYVKEILPRPDLLRCYQGSKEHLAKVVGNGIVRTEDVILRNKACYIVTERVTGTKLYDYLKQHQDDTETKRDLLYQIKKIVTGLTKYPDISSEFKESDFIVDVGGDVWLTEYEYGRMEISPEEIIGQYELILAVEEEHAESIEPEVCEQEEIKEEEIKEEEIKEEKIEEEKSEEEKIEEEFEEDTNVYMVSSSAKGVTDTIIQIDTSSNENNWFKLFYTIGACTGILLILWAVAGLLG